MQRLQKKLLLKLAFRGSLLFLLLVWFAHAKLSVPYAPVVKDPQSFLGRLAKKAGVSEKQAHLLLEELGPAVAAEVRKGHQVQLPGLGSFQLVKRPAATEFDEISGKLRMIPAAISVTYQPSPQLLIDVMKSDDMKWAGSEQPPAAPVLRVPSGTEPRRP